MRKLRGRVPEAFVLRDLPESYWNHVRVTRQERKDLAIDGVREVARPSNKDVGGSKTIGVAALQEHGLSETKGNWMSSTFMPSVTVCFE